MLPKNTFIVVDNDDHLDDFDAHSLNFNHERDVAKIAGVILRDTRKALGYLPVFYYDREGYITGFEGWGGDETEVTVVPDDLDLSVTLVTISAAPESKPPHYRYSAVSSQKGGQGGLEVKIYTKQSNTQPVIMVKAFVTQLNTQDLDPILELKMAVFQELKNGKLCDCDDPHYSFMHKEALTLAIEIEHRFKAGDYNPTSLIMAVHPTLVSGVAGAAT